MLNSKNNTREDGGLVGGADDYGLHENDIRNDVCLDDMHFHVVFKCHFDVGYSSLARDVVHEYQTTMVDEAMDVLDAHGEQFSWTFPGWPMEKILWHGQESSRLKRIEKALAEGKLNVHALPHTTHTGTLEMEDLVRGLGSATRICGKYNLPLPKCGKMTDVPGHTWGLVTILRHAGVEFFHFGSNPTNQVVDLPTMFWWEGPDGSRLLTMFSRGYGGGIFPPKDWKSKHWLTMVVGGDNAGPPSKKQVADVIDGIRSKYPNAEITVGSMDDYANAILKEGVELPVVRGDMSDSWVHGLMSCPHAIQTARHIRPLIPVMEGLYTQLKLKKLRSYSIKHTLAEAYENSLMFGEHTWGLANQHYVAGKVGHDFSRMYNTGLDPAYKRMRESWREQERYIERVEDRVIPELESNLLTLAENVESDELRIVVYNALPWVRSGRVDFSLPFISDMRNACALKNVDSGEVMPMETFGADVKRLGCFVAKDIPANGYNTYVLSEESSFKDSVLVGDKTRGIIENSWFKVTFDPNVGCIRSIINKKSGMELIDDASEYGFGQYLYERFSKDEALDYLSEYIYPKYKDSHYRITAKSKYLDSKDLHEKFSPKGMVFDCHLNEFSVVGTLYPNDDTGENEHTASISVTLYADSPCLDLKVTVINKPVTERPEAGWICLPFNIDNPDFRISRMGSIINPAADLLKGSQTGYLWTDCGLTIADKSGAGIGMCPIDSPAVSIGTDPDFNRFKPTFDADTAGVFVNLFNNRWNTNFRSFWNGNLDSQIRIWSFGEFDAAESLVVPGWESKLPLLAGAAVCPGGKLATSAAGLSVNRKGIVVTAFGEDPDGDGLILRLWEQAGQGGQIEVTLPKELKCVTVKEINLRGQVTGEEYSVTEGVVTCSINPFAPLTLSLHP